MQPARFPVFTRVMLFMLFMLLLLLWVPGVMGCDDGFTPALTNFRFEGAAEDSPLVLLLAVDFHDSDGDLDQGELQTFIDQNPISAAPLPLTPLFLESQLLLGASDGTLQFVLELSFGPRGPDAASSFLLGVRASDGQLHTSSTQEIRINITNP